MMHLAVSAHHYKKDFKAYRLSLIQHFLLQRLTKFFKYQNKFVFLPLLLQKEENGCHSQAFLLQTTDPVFRQGLPYLVLRWCPFQYSVLVLRSLPDWMPFPTSIVV